MSGKINAMIGPATGVIRLSGNFFVQVMATKQGFKSLLLLVGVLFVVNV